MTAPLGSAWQPTGSQLEAQPLSWQNGKHEFSRMRSTDRMTWIYVIEAGVSGPVKIGRADDPHARLASLQTGSPVDLTLVGYFRAPIWVEAALQQRFKLLRRRGEWFDVKPRGAKEHLQTLRELRRFLDWVQSRDGMYAIKHLDGSLLYIYPETIAA